MDKLKEFLAENPNASESFDRIIRWSAFSRKDNVYGDPEKQEGLFSKDISILRKFSELLKDDELKFMYCDNCGHIQSTHGTSGCVVETLIKGGHGVVDCECDEFVVPPPGPENLIRRS